MKKVTTLLLLTCLLGFVACGGSGDDDGLVEFTWHLNYTWATPSNWGADEVSRAWEERFNIRARQQEPDAIADEVLSLMIMADDLPDAIWMDRGPMNVEMTRMGLFYPIDELKEMVDNNWYDENVPLGAQRHYAVDGVNHVIPNWVRMGEFGVRGGATGGNHAWLKTTKVYEAVGSPDFVYLEDLYNYAVAVRDANLTNHAGVPITPVLFNGGPNYGTEFIYAIFTAMGGISEGWQGWYNIRRTDSEPVFGTTFNDPLWREAVLEANRWFREGLFPATNLTNTHDQFNENLINGLGGLIWHDHSVDNNIFYRRLLADADTGNSIEVIYNRLDGHPYLYLPSAAKGVPHTDVHHQIYSSLGWNGTFITRSAQHPGRIFELLTWMLTPLGSIEMMFGPEGHLWESLDANGFPILHTSPDEISAERRDEIGLWAWDFHGHSNNVDNAKFAANNALPPENRNWVDYMQATLFTPNLLLSDEFQLMAIQIDSTSDLGIRRTMIEEHFMEWLPQIILAPTEAEAVARFDSVRDFANANGMPEIENIYTMQWVYNSSLQGGSIFFR